MNGDVIASLEDLLEYRRIIHNVGTDEKMCRGFVILVHELAEGRRGG